MDATEKLAADVGTAAACRAMGVSRATLYGRRRSAKRGSGGSRGNPLAGLGFAKMFAMEFWGINHASEGLVRCPKTGFAPKTPFSNTQAPPTLDGRRLQNPRLRLLDAIRLASLRVSCL